MISQIIFILLAVGQTNGEKVAGSRVDGSQILSTTYKIQPESASAFLADGVIQLEKVVKGIDQLKGDSAKKRDLEIKSLVSGILDLNVLGQRALATHWEQLGKTKKGREEREKYMKLFRQLVEENYLEKARTYINGKYQIPLTNEKVSSNGTIFTAKINKTDVDLLVEFRLVKAGPSWRVVDIKLDETSLEETYRGSFNRVIKKKGELKVGMPELLAVMDRRLQELKKGRATSL
jgi:ABC-type transporter MlaC component